MILHDNLKSLIVFLASPGDVVKERKATQNVVDQVNKIVKQMGWQIDLRVWGDILPGHGRPQELINVDVQACKLFLGLLHTRWGSPTGKYSSGFEEEYRLALELKKQQGKPEICLFFKQVPPAQLKDPGVELKQVIEFRNEVMADREVLFKDVGSITEWKKCLLEILLIYVYRLNDLCRPQPADSLPPSPYAHGLALSSNDSAVEQLPVPIQLADALAAATSQALAPRKLTEFQAARLHLFATTALSRHTSSELGTHEMNFLYRHREELDATLWEQDLLYKTVLGGQADVVPGWYWFAGHDEPKTKELLCLFSNRARNESTRVKSVELLAECVVMIIESGPEREEYITQFLDDSSVAVKIAKLDYLSRVGILADLPVLANLCRNGDEDVRRKAEEAHTIILARLNPNQFLTDVVSGLQVLHESTKQRLVENVTKLDATMLRSAASQPDPELRVLAAKLMEERGEVTQTLAQEFSVDVSDKVKAIGYRDLLKRGTQVELKGINEAVLEEVKDFYIKALGAQPVEALKTQVNLYYSATEGRSAYEALANYHFAEFGDKLRIDLDDDCNTLREESIAKLTRKFGKGEITEYYAKNNRVDRFVRGEFLAIALDALARQGDQKDVRFARKYLSSNESSVRLAAIALLERFGDESDRDALLALTFGELSTRGAAANAAVRLTNGSHSVLRSLLNSTDSSVVRVGIESLKSADSTAILPLLIDLLRCDSVEVRVLAVFGISRLTDRATLESILNEYLTKRSRYYYNVVCWLDRILYAPEPLKGFYTRALGQDGLQRSWSILDDIED